jgi:hypothetical protein
MRKFWTVAAATAACLVSAHLAQAAGPACAAPACAAAAPSCTAVAGAAGVTGMGDACDPCNGRRQRYEGLDAAFNCGCNGSYKFPVPPLYTYHWPGMYSAQLMTEYHSPWRFPPLKPYADEVPPVEMGAHVGAHPVLRTVSASSAIELRPAGEPESMAAKMLRSR